MGIRLNKVLTELNIGLQTAVDFLKNKTSLGEIRDDATPNTKISDQSLVLLITNLCVRGGIVANFAQTPFAFQEINCRLKSYIQFC